MVININPNRINVRTGTAGKTPDRRSGEQDVSNNAYTVPKRSDVNHIPAPESLRTLIGSAVAAMRKGVYWDRGTILNLLV
jgi:hypothetical protein